MRSDRLPCAPGLERATSDELPAAGFSAASVDDAGIVGRSAPMRELRRQISRAVSERSVLLLGEAGSGKELTARAIHARHGRGRFVIVDCEDAPRDISWRAQLGVSQGGVLFLRRLGALGFEQQASLARALHARRGDAQGDARRGAILIAAMPGAPGELARGDVLRAEIVEALGRCTILVPPLRDRLGDLPDLVAHLLGAFCRRRCACIGGVSSAALGALSAYPWPGNVRELRDAIEHAVIHGNGAQLDLWDLPVGFHSIGPALSAGEGVAQSLPSPSAAGGLDELPTLAELQERLVTEALRRAGGNKSEAARALGISRHKLYDTLRRRS